MNKQRRLLVVSGPSGAGKDTIVKQMMQMHPEIEISVSATTRPKREGEEDGVHYHFLDNQGFEEKLANGEMLEHVNYCGKYYGTPKSEVDKRIENGITVVLVIEVLGAANLKKLYPDCTTVFILPPSMEVLEQRLSGRGTETQQVVAQRLSRAKEELEYAPSYDFSVVNEEIETCATALYEILQKRQQA